ncbi:MAG TPA: hypothetical protein PLJ35_01185 [Anaerolineae bacterium]|nr:hypothetical protein [Anaerolineae bacterium]HOQ97418.1 hypothetical protein [Anaerolineae bacterium]HPL27903.1 hypothetical protein [Anaerolineae bacterium]
MELGAHRWLPVVVLTAAVLGLILTESILAARNTVEIARPGQNEAISGVVDVRGTATGDDFSYYQLEYSAQGRPWTPIGQPRCSRQVSNGTLGVWDTHQLAPGHYQLRLSVADNMGNHSQSTIEVTVAAN